MLRSVAPISRRRNTGAKDRRRRLHLATVTGPRAGRVRPSRPCCVPARRVAASPRVPERRSRAQAQRARKFARAFWWGACTASTTPPGLSPQPTKTVYDAWQIPVHVASKNTVHLDSNSHLEWIAKHSAMAVAKSLAAGEARLSGLAKHSATTVAVSVGIGEDRPPAIAKHRAMTASVGVVEGRLPGIAKHSATTVAKAVGEARPLVELAPDQDECHTTARDGIISDSDCEKDLTKDEIVQLLSKLDEVVEVLHMREEGQIIPWLMARLLGGDTCEIAADARHATHRLHELWCMRAQHYDLAADESDSDDVGIEALVHGTSSRARPPTRHADWHRETCGDTGALRNLEVAEESDQDSISIGSRGLWLICEDSFLCALTLSRPTQCHSARTTACTCSGVRDAVVLRALTATKPRPTRPTVPPTLHQVRSLPGAMGGW